MRVVFLGFLSSGEEREQRPVTATRTGKVAVWDIRIKQKKKPETKLVREVDLRAESDKFVLCRDDLFSPSTLQSDRSVCRTARQALSVFTVARSR